MKSIHWPRIFRTRWAQLLLGVILLLAAIRLALPSVVRNYVNRKLNEIPAYEGHVGDIEIHLYRGAYKIINMELLKSNGRVPVPFFSSSEVDLALEWSELIHGALVGRIAFQDPKLNFVAAPSKEQSQLWIDPVWVEKVKALFPFKINSFRIENGEIHYRNFQSDPKIDLFFNRVYAVAVNITNSRKVAKNLHASIDADAHALNDAVFHMALQLDPYQDDPTFRLAADLKGLDMTRLNDFLKNYAKIDVERGRMSVYTELVAANGRIAGYVKPIFENLHFADLSEAPKQPLKLAWEAIVGLFADIFFTNQPKNRIGTEIPIEGSIKNPHTNIFAVIGSLLRNSFVRAISHGFENSASLKEVGGAPPKK